MDQEETVVVQLLEKLFAGQKIIGTSGNAEHTLNPKVAITVELKRNTATDMAETETLTISLKDDPSITHHPALAGKTALQALATLPQLAPYLPQAVLEKKGDEPLKIRLILPEGRADEIISALGKPAGAEAKTCDVAAQPTPPAAEATADNTRAAVLVQKALTSLGMIPKAGEGHVQRVKDEKAQETSNSLGA